MNEVYEITMIPVNEMKVDTSYQRQPDNKRVDNIAKQWDGKRANLIYVSHRTDGYYVIDGNHTRLAYEKVGGKELPCRVYEGLSVENEATLFYLLNSSQKKPRFGEIVKAKAAAGCEPELSYLQCLEEAGIEFTLTKATVGRIKCHGALLDIYRTTSYALMLRALKTAKKAADDRTELWQIGFFPGLCSLVTLHPDIDDLRLIDTVKKTSSPNIKRLADFYKNTITSSNASATKAFRKAYIDIYNKGLRANKIVES